MHPRFRPDPVNHTLDATPGSEPSTGCGLNVHAIIRAARRGDRFTLRLDGMPATVPRDACPRCIHDHVRWTGALVARDLPVLVDQLRFRDPRGSA
jgi:hypothetical protein